MTEISPLQTYVHFLNSMELWQSANVSRIMREYFFLITGKSLSEAVIFASTYPQYYDRLFIELQVQYMKIPSSNLGRTCVYRNWFWHSEQILYITCSPHVLQKRRASDKDLPVFCAMNFLSETKTFMICNKWNIKRSETLHINLIQINGDWCTVFDIA